jgi:hypothetical protein
LVGHGLAGGDRALGNADGAVHVGGAILENAMEVDAGALVAETVVDVDNHLVALGRVESGNGPLAVDADDGAVLAAIGVAVHPRHVEVIGDDGGVDSGEQREGREGEGGQTEPCHGEVVRLRGRVGRVGKRGREPALCDYQMERYQIRGD